MKPERWQRIDEIFGVALQHKPDERKVFLDEACRGDEELRQEVESLLSAEGAAVKFIEDPAMDILGKDLADEQRGVLIGRTLGPYKILSLLGAGGMGEVYRAEDRHLKRHVAVKVLASHFANDHALMARFQREARLLASLNHPNIAAIYGLEESNGVRALVMELVEGSTLGDRIAAGPIPLDEALPIALQMAEALEYSHEKGVIHRDLKPTNVKLTPEGTVKVLDFGLAKALEDGSATRDLEKSPTVTVATKTGVVLGTAAYMAPEQARGLAVDKRADIWSFGVVFYEMLTGRRLYVGATVTDTLAALLKNEPDWNALPREVPLRIRRLLRRCLTKDRRERLQAIGEARIEIAGYLADPAGEAVPTAAGSGVKQKLLLVGSGLALIIASVAVTWQLKRESAPPAPLRLEVTLSGDQPLALTLNTYFALSPDGRRLAYVAGRHDSRHLCVRSLDRLEREELVNVEFGHTPFFSPDGNWVGFGTPTELKKIPVSGGAVVTLCAAIDARGASWGPDDTIVFAPTVPRVPPIGLMKVSAAGGEPQVVTTLKEKEIGNRWPQHLPGGNLVLFTSYESADIDDGHIEVVDLKTGSRKLVHSGGTYARYAASGHLLYVHRNTLFAAPFDLGRLEITAKPVPVLKEVMTNGAGGAYYDTSPDGTLVYLSGQNASALGRLFWAEAGGRLTPLSDRVRNYSWPAIAPDGKRLAVTILEQGNWDVWIHDLERDSQTRLTFYEGADFYPFWSPDGRWIAYTSRRPHTQIYRQMADGSGQAERLLESQYDQAAGSFSFDGKYLLFGEHHPDTLWDIYVLELEGKRTVEVLANSRFDEGSPVFSPDGRWIAYQSDESGRYEIYVRTFRGRGGRRQISTKGGRRPRWPGDGRRVFYEVDNAVMSVAVRTQGNELQAGVPQAVVEVEADGLLSGNWDVAPDGKRLVLIRDEQSGASSGPPLLKFTFHWFEELKRLAP